MFNRLLKAPQGLLVDQDNYQKVWSHRPDDCRQLLPQFSFCLTPVFVRAKPTGLFYAVDFPDDEQWEKARCQQFKKIYQATAYALEPPVAA